MLEIATTTRRMLNAERGTAIGDIVALTRQDARESEWTPGTPSGRLLGAVSVPGPESRGSGRKRPESGTYEMSRDPYSGRCRGSLKISSHRLRTDWASQPPEGKMSGLRGKSPPAELQKEPA